MPSCRQVDDAVRIRRANSVKGRLKMDHIVYQGAQLLDSHRPRATELVQIDVLYRAALCRFFERGSHGNNVARQQSQVAGEELQYFRNLVEQIFRVVRGD